MKLFKKSKMESKNENAALSRVKDDMISIAAQMFENVEIDELGDIRIDYNGIHIASNIRVEDNKMFASAMAYVLMGVPVSPDVVEWVLFKAREAEDKARLERLEASQFGRFDWISKPDDTRLAITYWWYLPIEGFQPSDFEHALNHVAVTASAEVDYLQQKFGGESCEGWRGEAFADIEYYENSEEVEIPNWESFRRFWHESDLVITPHISGFIDIEGGHMSISGSWLPSCDVCSGNESCVHCGRLETNSISLRAGSGDGVYGIHELEFNNDWVGAFIVFDDGDYVFPLIEILREGFTSEFDVDSPVNESVFENVDEHFYSYLEGIDPNLEMLEIGKITSESNPVYGLGENEIGILIFGDSGAGLDSDKSIVALNNIRVGEYRVFVFGDRDPENKNCLIPHVVLVLEAENAIKIGLKNRFARKVDLKREQKLWNAATIFSKLGAPSAPFAIESNLLLLQMKLRSLESTEENWPRILDLMTEKFSWELLLTCHDESWVSVEELEDKKKVLQDAFPEGKFYEFVHHLRGQFGRELF